MRKLQPATTFRKGSFSSRFRETGLRPRNLEGQDKEAPQEWLVPALPGEQTSVRQRLLQAAPGQTNWPRKSAPGLRATNKDWGNGSPPTCGSFSAQTALWTNPWDQVRLIWSSPSSGICTFTTHYPQWRSHARANHRPSESLTREHCFHLCNTPNAVQTLLSPW